MPPSGTSCASGSSSSHASEVAAAPEVAAPEAAPEVAAAEIAEIPLVGGGGGVRPSNQAPPSSEPTNSPGSSPLP